MVDVSDENRDALGKSVRHDVALQCLLKGIEAAHPKSRVAKTVSVVDDILTITAIDGTAAKYDLSAYDNVVLIGGGNAAGTLAAALEKELGSHLDDGLVVTDNPKETAVVDVLSGDHPIPSERGVQNTQRVLRRAQEVGENDLVLVTITGGGSALLSAPAEPLSLKELQTVTERLLASGATINEINAIRKHCSDIKGGQLARTAAPATVATLVISDVIGDDLSVIASGPTVPDPSTYNDALEIMTRYELEVPNRVQTYLQSGHAGDQPETPKETNSIFDRARTHVIGNARTALEAARDEANEHGYKGVILASGVQGEARESALTHVAIAEECHKTNSPVSTPAVLVSSGETTVTLRDDHGRGGPNLEFALSSGLALTEDKIVVGSVDTDGIDGVTDAAGAIVDSKTVPDDRGQKALTRNDALTILEEVDAIIRTGPSGTNVNDLRVMVIGD